MTDDCISRQQAIDAVEKNACNTQRIMDAINNLPSAQPETNCSKIPNNCPAADVVSAVRCKDCKFRENDDFCTGRGFPYQLVPDDGFCDNGRKERR